MIPAVTYVTPIALWTFPHTRTIAVASVPRLGFGPVFGLSQLFLDSSQNIFAE